MVLVHMEYASKFRLVREGRTKALEKATTVGIIVARTFAVLNQYFCGNGRGHHLDSLGRLLLLLDIVQQEV